MECVCDIHSKEIFLTNNNINRKFAKTNKPLFQQNVKASDDIDRNKQQFHIPLPTSPSNIVTTDNTRNSNKIGHVKCLVNTVTSYYESFAYKRTAPAGNHYIKKSFFRCLNISNFHF